MLNVIFFCHFPRYSLRYCLWQGNQAADQEIDYLSNTQTQNKYHGLLWWSKDFSKKVLCKTKKGIFDRESCEKLYKLYKQDAFSRPEVFLELRALRMPTFPIASSLAIFLKYILFFGGLNTGCGVRLVQRSASKSSQNKTCLLCSYRRPQPNNEKEKHSGKERHGGGGLEDKKAATVACIMGKEMQCCVPNPPKIITMGAQERTKNCAYDSYGRMSWTVSQQQHHCSFANQHISMAICKTCREFRKSPPEDLKCLEKDVQGRVARHVKFFVTTSACTGMEVMHEVLLISFCEFLMLRSTKLNEKRKGVAGDAYLGA